MRRNLLCLLLIMLLIPHTRTYAQDRTYRSNGDTLPDDETISAVFYNFRHNVTQWADPYGRTPLNYDDWNAGRDAPGPLACSLVNSIATKNSARENNSFAVIVNSDLCGSLNAEINLYALDVAGEGFDVEIYCSSGGTPEEFRAFLQSLYASGMDGCVLIGDLPVAWYEMYGCWDPPYQEEFPCDLFYMDLDGVFEDTDMDGMYDLHTGSTSPDIWFGRLTASSLTLDGANEIDLLRNYFHKNHLYRSNLAPLAKRALIYTDDDWIYRADYLGVLMENYYPENTQESDPWITWHTDYESRLPQPYEFIQLWVHSSSFTHSFRNPAQQAGWTENWEIKMIDPRAYFYNLCSCFNSRHTDPDYMGGWYIFNQTYGLAAVSSSKAGEMLYFHDYYPSLGRRETIGRAFLNWFQAQAASGFWEWEACMFYGMTLLGDPTLRIQQKSNSAELRYDNEWCGVGCALPNAYGQNYFNNRFTALKSCSLSTILMLVIPTGTPTIRIYIWNSNGVFPTTVIDSIDLETDDITVGYWTAVDVSELGLTFSEGQDFHIGITMVNADPGESIVLHSCEWTDTIPVRSSLMDDGSWVMFDDVISNAHNFDIRAIVAEEPEETIEITTLTIPHADMGEIYSQAILATGGNQPYAWDLSAGDLPNGIGLNPATGIITGIPVDVDTAHFTIRATDNSVTPLTAIQHLTLITQTCTDSDGDDFGDPGHPENTCPDDNCPFVYNPDQKDTDGDEIGDACDFICGDANSDETVDVSDAVWIINYVFTGGDPPEPLNSGDPNCDGRCNVSDAVYIINYVFIGGSDPCDIDGDGLPDC